MRLGEVIRQFREREGISQREFARRCELSNSLISILEMGVNPQTGKPPEPDMRTYRLLAYGMGISVRQLDDLLRSSGTLPNIPIDGLSEDDKQLLEALHQDPELRMLFDRARKMSHEDVIFMRQFAERMKALKNGE